MSKGDQRGPAYSYDVKPVREQEMVIAGRVETAHERVVAHGIPRPAKAVRGGRRPARFA